MSYICSTYVDGYLFISLRSKADRLGVSQSKLINMAIIEYMQNHPQEKEDEERDRFDMLKRTGGEHK